MNRVERREALRLLAGLLMFSGWSVYTRYFDLNAFDLVTSMPFRELSMSQYHDTLAGIAHLPVPMARARLLDGRAPTESVTGLDPHVIDVALKTLALAASAALLYMFSTTLVSAIGAVLAAVLYLFVTAAAFSSEGYAIYFTNDYLAVLSWFAGALAIRHRAVDARRARRVRGRVGQGNRGADRLSRRRLRRCASARRGAR